jgi:hypothetical protein
MAQQQLQDQPLSPCRVPDVAVNKMEQAVDSQPNAEVDGHVSRQLDFFNISEFDAD